MLKQLTDQPDAFIQVTRPVLEALRQMAAARDPQAVINALRQHVLGGALDYASLIELGYGATGEPIAHIVASTDSERDPGADLPDSLRTGALHESLVAESPQAVESQYKDIGEYFDAPLGAAGLAVLPLYSRDRLVGYVLIAAQQTYRFHDNEVMVLQTLADQAAAVLDNHGLLMNISRVTEQLDLINALTHEMAGVLDLDELGQRVATTLADVMPLTHLSFAFHEPGETTVSTQTPHGKPLAETIDLSGTRIEEAITTERTIHVVDTSELAVSSWWQAVDAASLIIAPLVARDRVIGTLNLAADTTGGFSNDDAELAGQLAAQMGVSIENMRLFDQVQVSLREASTLYSASVALNATHNLDGAYDAVLTTLSTVLSTDHISLFIGGPNPREELQYVEVAAEWHDGIVRSGEENLPRYAISNAPVVGQFVQSRANLIFNDLANENRLDQAVRMDFVARGVKGLMLLPVSTGATWLGAVLVHARDGEAFTDEQARAARNILDQAAAVIDSHLVLGRAQQFAEREATLRELSAALSNTVDPDIIFNVLLDGLQEAIPHQACNILVVRDGAATPAALRGYTNQGVNETNLWQLKIPVEAADNLQQMVNTRHPYIVSDTETYEDWVTTPETAWVKSYIGAPVFLENELIGFISLDSAAPNQFTEDHTGLLQAIADQAALAIQNARQYQDNTRRAQFAGTINTVAAELQRTDTVDGVMEATVRVLRDSFAEYDIAPAPQCAR